METKSTIWGEMYDTLYEMKDELKDASFLKCLQLVDSLEKSFNFEEIKNSIDSYPLTTYELNRFNSLCLDGIVNTIFFQKITIPIGSIDKSDPLLALIRTSDNFQTFVYYFGKKFCSARHIAEICLFGRTKMLEYVLFRKPLPKDTKTPNNYPNDHECCYIFHNITIYDKEQYTTIGAIAAAKGHMDMVKLIFEKLHCCCNMPLRYALSAKNTEIARYILERTYEHQKKCDEYDDVNDIFVILCTYGNLELIQYMIDKNWIDLKPGTYALNVGIDEAQYYNQLHVVKFLEENYGGKVGAFSYYSGIQDNSFLYYKKDE